MTKKYKRQMRGETNSTVSAPNSAPGFDPDYSYVVKDLRRIGLLAGGFITLLVVLAFFLR